MLSGRVQGSETEAAKSDDCLASDSLRVNTFQIFRGKCQTQIKLLKAYILYSQNDTQWLNLRLPTRACLSSKITRRNIKENCWTHRYLGLHRNCDKGLHQSVERGVQAEK